MSDIKKFIVTKHAIDRLYERCPDHAKEIAKIVEIALKKKSTYDFINQSSEEKSFLNNSRFMIMLGEKYGFENRYTLFIKDNIVFVGVSNKSGNFIVTAMNRDNHYLSQIKNKVKKYENKSSEKLCNYYPPGGGLR
jgi:hypothetical protein